MSVEQNGVINDKNHSQHEEIASENTKTDAEKVENELPKKVGCFKRFWKRWFVWTKDSKDADTADQQIEENVEEDKGGEESKDADTADQQIEETVEEDKGGAESKDEVMQQPSTPAEPESEVKGAATEEGTNRADVGKPTAAIIEEIIEEKAHKVEDEQNVPEVGASEVIVPDQEEKQQSLQDEKQTSAGIAVEEPENVSVVESSGAKEVMEEINESAAEKEQHQEVHEEKVASENASMENLEDDNELVIDENQEDQEEEEKDSLDTSHSDEKEDVLKEEEGAPIEESEDQEIEQATDTQASPLQPIESDQKEIQEENDVPTDQVKESTENLSEADESAKNSHEKVVHLDNQNEESANESTAENSSESTMADKDEESFVPGDQTEEPKDEAAVQTIDDLIIDDKAVPEDKGSILENVIEEIADSDGEKKATSDIDIPVAPQQESASDRPKSAGANFFKKMHL